jgi:polyisoprenyl-phosphate glycosyltransferase
MTPAAPARPVLSVITPAFNEAENLPVLYQRLVETLGQLGISWEWIVVDDHSRDATFPVTARLAAADARVRGLRLARNSGSHLALTCGLHAARGESAVVLAADLQDPPETFGELLAKWRGGAQIVWAVRGQREGATKSALLFARIYYWIMQNVAGLRDTPSTGADFFLIDRRVIDAFCQFQETNTSMFALITWMGFRQERVEYVKQARLHGSSGWSLRKKIKLVLDSVTSFSEAPIRLLSYAGSAITALGLADAIFLAVRALAGYPTTGWPAVIAALLVLGGLQLIGMGVLGEYVWRALDESRRRPRFLIEDATPGVSTEDFRAGAPR